MYNGFYRGKYIRMMESFLPEALHESPFVCARAPSCVSRLFEFIFGHLYVNKGPSCELMCTSLWDVVESFFFFCFREFARCCACVYGRVRAARGQRKCSGNFSCGSRISVVLCNIPGHQIISLSQVNISLRIGN